MSTHTVNVVRIDEVRTHPNADSLDIIPVGNYQPLFARGHLR